MNVKLSVVIPMFNVEHYIINCLQSVLSQSIAEMEIIIIDDGSSDKSFSKVLEFVGDRFKNITLLKQENKGQAAARNYGLSKAKGKYISFIDADDFIHKQMYSVLISEAEKDDLDIAQCNYLNWYDHDSTKNFKYEFLNVCPGKVYDGITYFEYEPSLSPCDKIYKKQFLDEIIFRFQEGRYAEDVLEISKTIYYSNRIKYIDEIYYYYRRNSFNSTRNSTDINKTKRLGIDKIYIAFKLNEFRRANNWNGVIRKIIVRNIIGAFTKKEIIIKEYRKEVVNELLKRKGISVLIENFHLLDVVSFLKIGIEKILLKK